MIIEDEQHSYFRVKDFFVYEQNNEKSQDLVSDEFINFIQRHHHI